MRKLFAVAFVFLLLGFWFVGSYNSGYNNYYPTYGGYYGNSYARSYYYPTNVYYNYRPYGYGAFHW